MAMLEYNEILKGKVILVDGEPYEVLDAHVFRKQQRKPVNQTKLRHLITGKVTEQAFHVSEKMPEADLSTKGVKFLYTSRGEWWFSDEKNQSNRFKLEESTVGIQGKFLKANTVVEALIFDDPKSTDDEGKVIGLKLPIKVDLKVTEAMPAVKGNTAQGGSKQVTLETGTTLFVPMFINEGDVIRVNTELGEYVERADKN